MGLLFKNNAETTLSGGINDSVTTVPVTSAAVFPTPDANNVFFATIDDGTNVETVKVTGISSNDLTVVREQDNTSAAAFSSGAKIELRLNAKVLDMGTGSLTDLDGDTKIQVEESADEDIIRFDVGGSEKATLNSSGVLDVDGGITVDNITIDGTEIDLSSGDLTLDVAGDIILDADGGDISLKDGGTELGKITLDSAGLILDPVVSDKDFFVNGNDDGSGITALRLDMSDAGTAVFNHDVRVGDNSFFIGGAGDDITMSSDGTNGTIQTGNGNFTVDSEGDIILDANGADIIFKDDGTEIARFTHSASDLKIDSAGDIIFDAAGADFIFADDGTSIGTVFNSSSDFVIKSLVNDKDVIIQGKDGSSTITALTLDMSEAGAATFNDNVTAYSDERLKDNIETLTDGLDKVEQLRGVTYTRDERENIGVIAQEVEKILPEIVLTADDEMGTKSVDYSRLTAVLIEAVKDLSARVKELEDK